jgi:hypothetical protein
MTVEMQLTEIKEMKIVDTILELPPVPTNEEWSEVFVPRPN